MLDVFKSYATDETLENEGTWVTMNGAKWLVARSGNTKYANLMSALYTQNEIILDQKGPESEKLFTGMLIDVYAQAILLGWDDQVAYKGKPLPYSVENAKKLLAIKDFRKAIFQLADSVENFRFKQEEKQVKNS